MFKTIRRIINWCGEFKGKLYIGFVFSFFSNIFAAMPIMVAAYTVGMLIFFRFLFDYLRAKFQEAISYELIARDRLAIGDALKRVSLGYFQQMNTGNYQRENHHHHRTPPFHDRAGRPDPGCSGWPDR